MIDILFAFAVIVFVVGFGWATHLMYRQWKGL